MATTTPNYGWDVPTSSDYVKDGAVAIETLGDDIDSTLYTALGGNYPGLRLVKNEVISVGVASVVISNVFTSAFPNYLIQFRLSTSNATVLNFQARNGASTISTGYRSAYTFGAGTLTSGSGVADTSFGVISSNSGANAVYSGKMHLYSPQLTERTDSISESIGRVSSGATAPLRHWTVAFLDATTSFDGLDISVSAGTLTGNMQIYGYGAN